MPGVFKFASKCFIRHGMQSKDYDWFILTDFVGTGEHQINTDFIVLMVYSLQSNVLTLNTDTFQIVIRI